MTTLELYSGLMSATSLGISLLSAQLLALRGKHLAVYLPLCLFFIVNAFTDLSSIMSVSELALGNLRSTHVFNLSLIPLQLLLAPLFWIYVRNLTAEKLPNAYSFDALHLTFPLITLIVPLIAFIMPHAELAALFSKGRVVERSLAQQFIIVSVVSFNAMVVAQYALYIVLIIRRLSHYRTKLVHLFASNTDLELAWFRWLAGFLILYIILVLLSTTSSVFFDVSYSLEPWESLIGLALIWVLATWGGATDSRLGD